MGARTETRTYRFGPFALGADRRRLTREGTPVDLRRQSVDVLLVLLARAGHIVTKDDLANAVWGDVSVSDNTIDQAIAAIRKALGPQPDGTPYVETRKSKGFVFVAPATLAPAGDGAAAAPAIDLSSLLDPHLAFVDGRAAIETFDRDAVTRARAAFEQAIRLDPSFVAAHIGLANARFLAYEETRVDAEPDRAALADAERHARDACRLDPSSGDAWSTLAMALERKADPREALAAARKAVTLEPQEYRQQLRLAAVGWGADRLRAAERMRRLGPNLALGHWFAATVLVARGALDEALEYLRAGCAVRAAQQENGTHYTAVGLHWLHGLVLAARGATDAARDDLNRELALLEPGHVYAREMRANTYYALGALALRDGRLGEARRAFDQALALVPAHRLAAVGLAAANATSKSTSNFKLRTSKGRPSTVSSVPTPLSVDEAFVHAAALTLQSEHAAAARLVGDALAASEPGPAGWLLPIEPLIHVSAHPDVWTRPLAILADRAV